ncbi:PREDICTED: probable WRKY transcription factor 4 isoform X2 [Ipomoea nil]|uniref:probable WRKY transcription factor 4 isoform X2 n=1 Tax=Ipomoea nil TaxID=35883 RepID=UPI00090124D6|nr:PREDICTED: probable WRKY transcription factor 4 isoform X2 [Ipomoea nil]
MGESREGVSAVSGPPRPTITIPPRAPFDTLFALGSIPGFSPGPMTLMSSFFSDSDACSFSQLLAGAMASPLANPTLLPDNPLKVGDSGPGSEKLSGYKQKQPMSLLVAQSPLFMVSPRFSPSGLLNSPGFLSPLQSPFGMSHQQALAHVTAQAAFNHSYKQMQAEYQHSSSVEGAGHQTSSSMPNQGVQGEAANVALDPESLKVETSELSQVDGKVSSGAIEKPASDGYNWRKYGQKLVKGSECPRSYYRCTHLNCAVRKKVERSPDGHIIEITYKGKHNHEIPKSNKRKLDDCDRESREDNSREKPQSGSRSWTETNRSNKVVCSQPETVSKRNEMEETATVLDEKDDGEPNAERRISEAGSSHKTVMEPKIIVQTRSEVDLLDDGYKWRKYGQKVVKGNANPRSYYRCTYKGCNVRKHVERASADPKAVITTYEGKHNHDTPNAPNNNHSVTNKSSIQKLVAA